MQCGGEGEGLRRKGEDRETFRVALRSAVSISKFVDPRSSAAFAHIAGSDTYLDATDA